MPPSFDMLTPTEREDFLVNIRNARLDVVRRYEEAVAQRSAIKNEKIAAKVDKKLAQFQKQLLAVDKNISKLEEINNQISALVLQKT